MTDIDDLRRSLEGFADQARPADLGPAALDGARRRRLRQRISVAVVLLLLAGVLVPMSVMKARHDAQPVVDLPAGPMGPQVVTAYAADRHWYVIDPAAGRYRQLDGGQVTSVSPNLRLYTDLATLDGLSTVLRITSTSGDGPNTFLTIAGRAIGPSWSPDGNWLAVPAFEEPKDSLKRLHGFTDIVIVDVINGTMRRQKIGLGDRYGGWVQWADDETLLVGTERERARADGVAVVRRNGKVVSRYPLPAAEPCSSDLFAIPPAHDGKLLNCAYEGSQQVYRVVDPRRGTTGPELGRLPLPSSLNSAPVWWGGDDRLALKFPDLESEDGAHNLRVAQLSTGVLEASPPGLPKRMQQMLVGSSDGLSTETWRITF